MTEHPTAGRWTNDERRALVAAIHDAPHQLVLVVAGGGNAIITDLLDVPGASRTILEIVVPYAESAMADFLGGAAPGAAVSAETASALAAAARERGGNLAPGAAATGVPLLGVACTAALVTDRPRRGEHRAELAVATGAGISGYRVELVKGELDRAGEDRAVADAVLAAVAEACGIEPLDHNR